MAVNARVLSTSLVLAVETDTAPDGSAVYSNRTISRINPALADADAYDIAAAFGTLQYCPVGDIYRTKKELLTRA